MLLELRFATEDSILASFAREISHPEIPRYLFAAQRLNTWYWSPEWITAKFGDWGLSMLANPQSLIRCLARNQAKEFNLLPIGEIPDTLEILHSATRIYSTRPEIMPGTQHHPLAKLCLSHFGQDLGQTFLDTGQDPALFLPSHLLKLAPKVWAENNMLTFAPYPDLGYSPEASARDLALRLWQGYYNRARNGKLTKPVLQELAGETVRNLLHDGAAERRFGDWAAQYIPAIARPQSVFRAKQVFCEFVLPLGRERSPSVNTRRRFYSASWIPDDARQELRDAAQREARWHVAQIADLSPNPESPTVQLGRVQLIPRSEKSSV